MNTSTAVTSTISVSKHVDSDAVSLSSTSSWCTTLEGRVWMWLKKPGENKFILSNDDGSGFRNNHYRGDKHNICRECLATSLKFSYKCSMKWSKKTPGRELRSGRILRKMGTLVHLSFISWRSIWLGEKCNNRTQTTSLKSQCTHTVPCVRIVQYVYYRDCKYAVQVFWTLGVTNRIIQCIATSHPFSFKD